MFRVQYMTKSTARTGTVCGPRRGEGALLARFFFMRGYRSKKPGSSAAKACSEKPHEPGLLEDVLPLRRLNETDEIPGGRPFLGFDGVEAEEPGERVLA